MLTKNMLFSVIIIAFAIGLTSCSKDRKKLTLNERMDKVSLRIEDKKALLHKFSKIQRVKFTIPKDTPILGNRSANNEIIIFSDFLCSFCDYILTFFLDYVKENNNYKLYYISFPIEAKCNPIISDKNFHQGSCDISIASLAAHQSHDFWTFIKRYSKLKASNDKDSIDSLLSKYLNENTLDIKKSTIQLTKNINLALKLGIYSTPIYFINGKRIDGAYPATWLKEILDKEGMN